MFLKNKAGRIVGVPYEMEVRGYKQAVEIYSISKELMDQGAVITGRPGFEVREGRLEGKEIQNLRDTIMARFPGVITDEEYLAKHGAEHERETEVNLGAAEGVSKSELHEGVEDDIKALEEQKKALEEKIKKQKKMIEEEDKEVEQEPEQKEEPTQEVEIEVKSSRKRKAKEKEEEEKVSILLDSPGRPRMEITEDMLKDTILEAADFYDIELKAYERRLGKAKVIKLMNERYKRPRAD